MFDEHRLCNYGTNAARPSEPSKSNDEMNEKDDKITHLGIVSNLKLLGLPAHFVIRQGRGVSLHLVGVKSNRGAMGARIAVTVLYHGGKRRTVCRTVGSGGSFGASPLQQHVGLGESAKIEKIEVGGPLRRRNRLSKNVGVDQFVEIKEFERSLQQAEVWNSFQLGGPARRARSEIPSGG